MHTIWRCRTAVVCSRGIANLVLNACSTAGSGAHQHRYVVGQPVDGLGWERSCKECSPALASFVQHLAGRTFVLCWQLCVHGLCQLIMSCGVNGSTAVQISSPQSLHSQTTVNSLIATSYVRGLSGTAYGSLCKACAVVQARACCHVGLFLSM
jgi:hypothetical protein